MSEDELFDVEWLRNDGHDLTAYDKAKAIWLRAMKENEMECKCKCKCNMREKLVGDGRAFMVNTAKDLEYAKETIAELEARLREIGDYAHDHSTGPAVPDALWAVREMAYELV